MRQTLVLCPAFGAGRLYKRLGGKPPGLNFGDVMLRRASANWVVAGCLVVASAACDSAARAEVVISINKATQSMSVLIDGEQAYSWVVSTGVGGGPHDGTYRPGRMERQWASRKYGMAPMPYSIFFDGNYAIHGTDKVAQLGRRASKGCVRLHPRDAAVLFALVGREKANTTIVVDKATHVAARAMPVRNDAPAVEAKPEPAKVEAPTIEQPKPQLAKVASIIFAEPAAAPARKRASRKASRTTTAAGRPPPFWIRYGAAR